MTRIDFASDNTAPAHPSVLEQLQQVNQGPAPAYGQDRWTAQAEAWFRLQFGEETATFLVWNGTGANIVGLRSLAPSWGAILCAATAHINADECAAPEFFTGCKLVDIATPDGKLTPALLHGAIRGIGNEHAAQPAVVSLSQPTEYGTLYTVEELQTLCAIAHEAGLLVHLDGARIANAVAALGLPVHRITRDLGVDVLSFGLTKNGALGVEAVLVFDPTRAATLPYLRKQSAQLASKMRYLAAQLLALVEEDRWITLAAHANAMARRLGDGLAAIPGVHLTQAVAVNAVFAVIPEPVTARLLADFHFYRWDERRDEVRLMTSWCTTVAEVDALIAAVARTMASQPDG